MAEQKKDMTALMDYAKAMQDAGLAPPVPAGSVMEEQKIEKVDDFESLEEYGKANPAPEPTASEPPAPEPVPEPEPEPEPVAVAAPDNTGMPSDDAFATTPSESDAFAGLNGGMDAIPGLGDGGGEAPGATDLPSTDFAPPPPAEAEPAVAAIAAIPDPPAQDMPAAELAPEPPAEPEPVMMAPSEPSEQPAPAAHAAPEPATLSPPAGQSIASHIAPDAPQPPPTPQLREPLRPATKTPTVAKKPLERVKQYSEQMSPGKAAVPAAYPFSLLITGHLAPEERERLLDLLSRENMGIREIDLEPQFESGKILIPRISEYAGVMLVSALRTARATIRLGPSDSIYATPDTQAGDEEDFDSGERAADTYNADGSHPAEDLPITSEAWLPGQEVQHAVVDIVTASAAMKTLVIEAESSPEYQMLLETLQRELKYKAFRKGANAIVNFSVHLTQMHLPSHYRVMVTGSAVKNL